MVKKYFCFQLHYYYHRPLRRSFQVQFADHQASSSYPSPREKDGTALQIQAS